MSFADHTIDLPWQIRAMLSPEFVAKFQSAFSALTVLVGCQEEHPACEN